jgi:hypothetical protein
VRGKPTARELASLGAKDQKKRGSVDWCWQAIGWLKTLYSSSQATKERWKQAIHDIEDQRVWEKVPPEKPYGSLEAMFKAELGVTPDEADTSIRERAVATTKGVNALQGHGANQHGVGGVDNIKSTSGATPSKKGGTSAAYLAARLKRDAPEVATRLEAGEFRSVYAAAVEAGIVKKRKHKNKDMPTISPSGGKPVAKSAVKTLVEDVAPALRPADAKRVVDAALERLEPKALDDVARKIVPIVESDTLSEIIEDLIAKLDDAELEKVVVLAASRLAATDKKRLTRALRKIRVAE